MVEQQPVDAHQLIGLQILSRLSACLLQAAEGRSRLGAPCVCSPTAAVAQLRDLHLSARRQLVTAGIQARLSPADRISAWICQLLSKLLISVFPK